MKIKIEMNNIEREFAESMMSKWTSDPDVSKVKTYKTVEKYGKSDIILNEDGSCKGTIELDTDFMLEIFSMVGDAADMFKGIFSSLKLFFKNFKNKMRKWDMSENESLARYIFSKKEHEETELLMIWNISKDIFRDSFILRESDPLALIQKIRADGYEPTFWEDHDGLPKEVNPMDAIGVLLDLQKEKDLVNKIDEMENETEEVFDE